MGKVRFRCRDMVKIQFWDYNVVPGSTIYVTSNSAKSGRAYSNFSYVEDYMSYVIYLYIKSPKVPWKSPEDLTWSAHTDAVLKKAHQRLFFLRRLRKFGTSPRILRSFYTCTVESILTGCITAWYGNSTAGNRRALQRVARTARHIVGGELPSLQDIYTRRCTRKARRIIKDSSHPSHSLLSLLPSGRRFRSIRSRTSRLRDSFFPQAIRLMNSHK